VRWLVVSPHLDDAVFGCGQWLARHPGSIVATVFAGVPPDADVRTPWDASSGFGLGAAEAIAARREEDARALGLLDARPLWLPYCDSQYGHTPAVDEVAQRLHALLQEANAEGVLLPLGLYHSDHLLAHEATMSALRSLGRTQALAYEDALYRGLPGVLQRRLAALLEAGVESTPAPTQPQGFDQAKARAVAAYASQLRAFGERGHDDLARPERLWTLQRIDEHQAAA